MDDVDVEYFKNCFIDFFDKGATIRPIFFYGEYKAGCQIENRVSYQIKGSIEYFIINRRNVRNV
jgi:hypothetical protein